jgi:tape measure domain-containing protein
VAKGIEWVLTLRDKMSGVLSRASNGLERLTADAKRASRAVDSIKSPKILGPNGAAMGAAFGKAGDAANKAAAGAGRFGNASRLAGAAGVAAGHMIAEAMMRAASAAVGVGTAIAAQKRFIESSRFAFDTLFGKKGGGEAFQAAIDAAKLLGRGEREIITSYNALLAQGFDLAATEQIVKAMADLSAINPSANLEGITRAMVQIKATGYLQGDELNQLREAGLNTDRVYEELGKRLGKTREEILKMQEARQLGAEDVTASILASVSGQTGKELGAVAQEKSANTVDGQLGRIQNRAEALARVMSIDGAPMIAGLSAVERLMDPSTEAGGHLLVVFEKIAAVITRVGGGLLEGLTSGLERMAPMMSEMMRNLDGGDLENIATAAAAVGEGVALSVGAMITIFTALGEAISAVVSAVEWLGDAIAGIDLSSASGNLGEAIIDGIVAGIEAGASAVANAISDVASGAIAAAEDVLGIASPSKVFAGIGENVALGMAEGISAAAPVAQDAAYSMGSFDPASVGAAAGSQSSSVNNSKSIDIGAITIQTQAQDAGGIAGAIASALESIA